ncbi:hypothetical protein [Pelagibaculum spongiae]|uniref:hypothetical protein n=1 Tax=Pelagibaculum spongiae TaxID=2080658 RepID=UPI0013146B6F|nr:hypothetical protein [Pelagibaculum spongiae]
MPRRNRAPATGISIDSASGDGQLMKASRVKRTSRAHASLKATQRKSHNSRYR